VVSHLLLVLRGPEVLTDEDMDGLSSMLHTTQERELDSLCRRLAVEALLILALASTSARTHLRAKKVYPIIREAEKLESDATTTEAMHKLVEYLMLLPEAPTPSPSQTKFPEKKNEIEEI